jgi:energy-coupling factor transporter ATP-binding protein EcfA2
MQLFSDNPASIDTLGSSAIADLLSKVVVETSPPFAMGLFGEWGSGKTTLMRMMDERIRSTNRKTVWFNAWKYDGKEVIWNALIQAVFYAMRNDPEIADKTEKDDFRKRVGQAAISLAKYAAKVGTRFVPGGLIKEEDVDTIVDAFHAPAATSDHYEFINKFEKTFDDLVKEYVGDNGTLTVFIDDLDRCLPENAISVLEALKLYLDRASCVFVIGAESGIIEQGIRIRYGANARLSARDYIEKIIQLPFMMRGINKASATSLLLVNDRMKDFMKDVRAQELIAEATSYNPRRLKRYLNTLLILETLIGAIDNEKMLTLSKVLLIQMRFPDLYQALLKNNDTAELLSTILTKNPMQQEAEVSQGSDIIKSLYADQGLRLFLSKTKTISCSADAITPWIQLTNGVG